MKTLLLALMMMFTVGVAHAADSRYVIFAEGAFNHEADAFVASPIGVDYSYGTDNLRVDVSFPRLGLFGKVGGTYNNVNLYAGAGAMFVSQRGDVDVAGVPIAVTGQDFTPTVFVEATYSKIFARVSHSRGDVMMSATRQTGVDGSGNPVYSSASRNSAVDVTTVWVGYQLEL